MESVDVAARECASCGERMSTGARFCGRCGASATDRDPAKPQLPTPLPFVAGEVVPAPVSAVVEDVSEAHGRGVPLYVLLGTGIFTVLLVVFGVMWHGASAAHTRSEKQLRSARSHLQSARAENRRLTASLSESRKLSNRRAEVLARADKVLGQVTPLLSAVDGMQTVSGKMRDVRDEYQRASAALTSDLISLSDYLLTAGDYADYSYVSGEIDVIRGDIADVNGYASELGGLDARYEKASSQFETRASAFDDAVERLKTESIATAAGKTTMP
jgi:hypothetical protein